MIGITVECVEAVSDLLGRYLQLGIGITSSTEKRRTCVWTAWFWDEGSRSLHVANGKAACEALDVGSLEAVTLGIVIVLIDVFEASAIVDKKLSRHTMAKRLLLETLELHHGFGVDIWSARLWIDKLRWIEVENDDIAEFISIY